jgi:hypothetical protein
MAGVRNYLIVTASYMSFTLTDGALRMLVLLHFYALGYTCGYRKSYPGWRRCRDGLSSLRDA